MSVTNQDLDESQTCGVELDSGNDPARRGLPIVFWVEVSSGADVLRSTWLFSGSVCAAPCRGYTRWTFLVNGVN